MFMCIYIELMTISYILSLVDPWKNKNDDDDDDDCIYPKYRMNFFLIHNLREGGGVAL